MDILIDILNIMSDHELTLTSLHNIELVVFTTHMGHFFWLLGFGNWSLMFISKPNIEY